LQTSPPDTSLARRFPLCSLLLPPLLTAGAGPPPAATHAHASSPLDPDLFPLPCCPLARAPRRPRTTAGRQLLVAVDSSLPRLNSQSLARNNIPLTPTSYSSSPTANSRAPDPNFAAALSSSTPVTTGHRGQPSPGPLRPNQLLPKLPHSSLVLLDHLLPSNFDWSFVSDDHRPPPPSAPPWAARSKPFHATAIP
jgi:hypothetical protein